jgi:hypothetical protein
VQIGAVLEEGVFFGGKGVLEKNADERAPSEIIIVFPSGAKQLAKKRLWIISIIPCPSDGTTTTTALT